MTRIIIAAVIQSGCRAILSKGWSGRGKEGAETIFDYPPQIYSLDSVPHDWLFPQCTGVIHHGGAGTTAAGLRAGVPTMIRPFFGDQFFWAERVQEVIYTNVVGCRVESTQVQH
jgi:sterol 3beta-glucosyltransferase